VIDRSQKSGKLATLELAEVVFVKIDLIEVWSSRSDMSCERVLGSITFVQYISRNVVQWTNARVRISLCTASQVTWASLYIHIHTYLFRSKNDSREKQWTNNSI